MSEITDILDRDKVVDNIITVAEAIRNTKSSYSVALNGVWGSGKTFVLDMLEKKLREEDDYRGNYVVFHYNCLQYDYYAEPLEAIIAAISDEIDEQTKVLTGNGEKAFKAYLNTIKTILLDAAGEIIKNKIGINVAEDVQNGIKAAAKSHDYDSLFPLKKMVSAVQKAMKNLTDKYTVVLVVDELDRCLPEYAIKVLERLHHLFHGQSNMMMLLAVDKSQLERTVTDIFGDKTSTDGYLKKFIDFEIELPIGTANEKVMEKYKDYFDLFELKDEAKTFIAEYFSNLFEGIDIRKQEKLMKRVEMVHRLNHLTKYEKKDVIFVCSELMWAVFMHHNILSTPFSSTSRYTLHMLEQLNVDKEEVLQSFVRYFNHKVNHTPLPSIVYAVERLYQVTPQNLHGKPINGFDINALTEFRDLFAIIR